MSTRHVRCVSGLRRAAVRPSGGFTLVELLVGLALGWMLLAAAGIWLAAQVQAQRRIVADARIDQDLRAAADLLARELRRAGHWGAAARVAEPRAAGSAVPRNPYADVFPAEPGEVRAADAGAIGYAYTRDDVEDDLVAPRERFGFRLNPATHALEMRQSGMATAPDARDRWQQVTDPAVVKVTSLDVSLRHRRISLLDQCAATTCGPGDTDCPPQVTTREYLIHLQGARPDRAQRPRHLETVVRLRNDDVRGRCPA